MTLPNKNQEPFKVWYKVNLDPCMACGNGNAEKMELITEYDPKHPTWIGWRCTVCGQAHHFKSEYGR